jgi:hypothetical protein
MPHVRICGSPGWVTARGYPTIPVDGECGQEAFDLRRTHFPRMSLATCQDESPYPTDIGLFRAHAVMFQPHYAPDFIKQTGRPLARLAVRYTFVSADVTHYTPAIATLHGSMPIPVIRYHQPSACCGVGKILDSPEPAVDSTPQHPKNGD